MAPETVTHDRVYRAIKDDIRSGLVPPRLRIDIRHAADRWSASHIPVREALYRLVGEGLVVHDPEGGFQLALPDVAGLIQLYQWTARLLLGALHISTPATIGHAMSDIRRFLSHRDVDGVRAVEATFQAVAGACSNQEFYQAIQRSNERLVHVRLAERRCFRNFDDEMLSFVRNGDIDVKKNVGRRISEYHKRRIDHVEDIHNRIVGEA